jgi:hypothetical protein
MFCVAFLISPDGQQASSCAGEKGIACLTSLAAQTAVDDYPAMSRTGLKA